jgi:membrane protein required for colicin V production
LYANWLDLAIGGIILFSALAALFNGATREIVRIVALVFGLAAAMWGYERPAVEFARYIGDPRAANFLGFASIVVAALALGSLVAWVLVKLWGAVGLRWFDRLLGGAFGMVRGLVAATALVLAVVAFAPVAGSEQAVADSRLAPWVLHGARAAAVAAPAPLRQAYDAGFERVREAWSGVPLTGSAATAQP